MSFDLPRRLAAEAAGTAVLLATVVGSGIMADALSDDGAVTLLANALPTGAVLVVLIVLLRPISGAHLNPLISAVAAARRELSPGAAIAYVGAQLAGAVAGVLLAHAMFDLSLVQFGATARTGIGQWIGEFVAAFGLVSVVLVAARRSDQTVATLVGLYIAAAYWFTSSTSFANPAVALARSFTDTFAGIRPVDVAPFAAAEAAGAVAAFLAMRWLLAPAAARRGHGEPVPPVLAAGE